MTPHPPVAHRGTEALALILVAAAFLAAAATAARAEGFPPPAVQRTARVAAPRPGPVDLPPVRQQVREALPPLYGAPG